MQSKNLKIPLKIIYSDKYFLAVDKPSGLVVHSDGRTTEETLDDWVKENFPELENVGNPHTLDSGRYAKRWGIVNRLDRDTSGIILIAKTEDVFFNLQKQFLDRSIKKEYIAKVWAADGVRRPSSGKITEPISRHKKDPRLWVSGTGVGERQTKRDAETDYEFVSPNRLRLWPKTGRTHQLRLHARFLGMPIVGDKKYGINGITNEHSIEKIKNVLEKLNEGDFAKVIDSDKNSRLMLHAKSLEFLHPVTGERVFIETEIPKEFDI